jgi:hypothetical protein
VSVTPFESAKKFVAVAFTVPFSANVAAVTGGGVAVLEGAVVLAPLQAAATTAASSTINRFMAPF